MLYNKISNYSTFSQEKGSVAREIELLRELEVFLCCTCMNKRLPAIEHVKMTHLFIIDSETS